MYMLRSVKLAQQLKMKAEGWSGIKILINFGRALSWQGGASDHKAERDTEEGKPR